MKISRYMEKISHLETFKQLPYKNLKPTKSVMEETSLELTSHRINQLQFFRGIDARSSSHILAAIIWYHSYPRLTSSTMNT